MLRRFHVAPLVERANLMVVMVQMLPPRARDGRGGGRQSAYLVARRSGDPRHHPRPWQVPWLLPGGHGSQSAWISISMEPTPATPRSRLDKQYLRETSRFLGTPIEAEGYQRV